MAAQIAEPITKTNKITMVSSNGDIGASKLTGEVLHIMTQMPEMVKAMSGIDISKVAFSKIYAVKTSLVNSNNFNSISQSEASR